MLSERAAERGSASLTPSPSLQQPSLCISKSLHCTTAHRHSRGLFPLPEPGTSAVQMFPAHWDAWLPTSSACCLQTKPDGTAMQGISGVSLDPSSIHTPKPILQAISAPAKIKITHTHKDSVRTQWHKLKPSINSQAGFPASLGQGLVFQVSATSLKEVRQGTENRHRLVKYFRKGKKMGELVLVGHTPHNSWTHNFKEALE